METGAGRAFQAPPVAALKEPRYVLAHNKCRSVCILVGVHVLVCQAIAQRRVIRFHYDGGTRDIEPHVHGFGQDGGELLRGYQVSGFSRSGQVSGWKMFRLAEVRAMAVTDRRFASPRAGYEPADALMPTIHCRL